MPSLKHRMRMKHPNMNHHQFLELTDRFNSKVEKHRTPRRRNENFKRFIRFRNRTVVMIKVYRSRRNKPCHK